jgi:anti-anti-sigma factor
MASAARKLRTKKALSKEPEVQQDNSSENSKTAADHTGIAVRAYELWQSRGCPVGSPDVDWFQAEELLSAGQARVAGREPHFEIEQRDDICLVRISGRLATGTDYGYVATKTREIKSAGASKLVIDIRDLDSIGSEGVGFFVELHASMTKKPGGLFVLAGTTPRVLEVLSICGLGSIIRTTADLATALTLCGSGSAL